MPQVILAAVKAELARAPAGKLCCRKAEVVVALRLAGGLRPAGTKVVVEADFDSAGAAERLRVSLLEVFGQRAQVATLAPAPAQSRGGRRWVVRIADNGQVLARQAGLLDGHARPMGYSNPPLVAGGICDAEAALRAAVLARGSLAWRGNTRELHVLSPDPEASVALTAAARRLGHTATTDEGPGGDVVVICDQDAITALLARLGAPIAAQAWVARVVRAPAGGAEAAGRLGFHAANRDRAAAAAAATAARVANALQVLADVEVPAHLAAAGRLRLAHPEASLEDLAALADPPLTKGTMVGRIRRLLALADEHRT
jgi:DNA-binding protein WhiA